MIVLISRQGKPVFRNRNFMVLVGILDAELSTHTVVGNYTRDSLLKHLASACAVMHGVLEVLVYHHAAVAVHSCDHEPVGCCHSTDPTWK